MSKREGSEKAQPSDQEEEVKLRWTLVLGIVAGIIVWLLVALLPYAFLRSGLLTDVLGAFGWIAGWGIGMAVWLSRSFWIEEKYRLKRVAADEVVRKREFEREFPRYLRLEHAYFDALRHKLSISLSDQELKRARRNEQYPFHTFASQLEARRVLDRHEPPFAGRLNFPVSGTPGFTRAVGLVLEELRRKSPYAYYETLEYFPKAEYAPGERGFAGRSDGLFTIDGSDYSMFRFVFLHEVGHCVFIAWKGDSSQETANSYADAVIRELGSN